MNKKDFLITTILLAASTLSFCIASTKCLSVFAVSNIKLAEYIVKNGYYTIHPIRTGNFADEINFRSEWIFPNIYLAILSMITKLEPLRISELPFGILLMLGSLFLAKSLKISYVLTCIFTLLSCFSYTFIQISNFSFFTIAWFHMLLLLGLQIKGIISNTYKYILLIVLLFIACLESHYTPPTFFIIFTAVISLFYFEKIQYIFTFLAPFFIMFMVKILYTSFMEYYRLSTYFTINYVKKLIEFIANLLSMETAAIIQANPRIINPYLTFFHLGSVIIEIIIIIITLVFNVIQKKYNNTANIISIGVICMSIWEFFAYSMSLAGHVIVIPRPLIIFGSLIAFVFIETLSKSLINLLLKVIYLLIVFLIFFRLCEWYIRLYDDLTYYFAIGFIRKIDRPVSNYVSKSSYEASIIWAGEITAHIALFDNINNAFRLTSFSINFKAIPNNTIIIFSELYNNKRIIASGTRAFLLPSPSYLKILVNDTNLVYSDTNGGLIFIK